MASENIKKEYTKLEAKKEQFVDRGRECSELTIASLLPPEGFSDSSDLYTPYQSVGARGVNNLASKLLLLLLPPNEPFFRLTTSNKINQELSLDMKVAHIEGDDIVDDLKMLKDKGEEFLHMDKNLSLIHI